MVAPGNQHKISYYSTFCMCCGISRTCKKINGIFFICEVRLWQAGRGSRRPWRRNWTHEPSQNHRRPKRSHALLSLNAMGHMVLWVLFSPSKPLSHWAAPVPDPLGLSTSESARIIQVAPAASCHHVALKTLAEASPFSCLCSWSCSHWV